jgi:hypothetical protein
MKIKIIILALSIMVIMLCVIFLTPPLINMRERSIKSSEALDRISAHLDVDADWDVVRNKIYCDILREGETLERIESSLNEITSVTMFKEDDLWYTIYFTEPYVNIDDVGLTFDKNNHLIGKFRRVGIGDVTAINCP